MIFFPTLVIECLKISIIPNIFFLKNLNIERMSDKHVTLEDLAKSLRNSLLNSADKSDVKVSLNLVFFGINNVLYLFKAGF